MNIINQFNKNISTKEKLKSEEVELFITQKKKGLRAKKPNKKYKRTANSYVIMMDKLDFYEFRLALSYQGNGQFEQAKKLLRQIAYRSGHEFHVAALYQLGLLAFENKQWKDAIKYWNEYNQQETRKDNIVATKFLMANAYETMEDLEKAYNLYYSILGEYPNPEVVKNRLNAIYNRKVARKR